MLLVVQGVGRQACLSAGTVCLWSPPSLPVQLSLPSSQVSGVAVRAGGHPSPRDTYCAFSRVGISVGRPHSEVHVGCPCLVIFHRALSMCGWEGGSDPSPSSLALKHSPSYCMLFSPFFSECCGIKSVVSSTRSV